MRLLLLLAALAALGPRPAWAQVQAPPSPQLAYDPLSYVRARYAYPGAAAGRADPVVPPAEILSGRGLPSLRLGGIIFDLKQPRRSSASLTLDGGPGGETRAVRVGDRIGAYEVVRIRPAYVEVRDRVFGTVTRLDLHPEQTPASRSSDPRPSGAPTSRQLREP